MAIGTPISLGTASAASGSTSLVLTTTATAPAGSVIVVFACATTGVNPTGCADGASNGYVTGASVYTGTGRSRTFASVNVATLASGSSLTVTFGSTGGAKLMSAAAITGLAARDISGAGASGTGTAPSIASGALGWPAEIVLAYVQASGGAADGFTEAAGFTTLSSVTQIDALRSAYAIVATTAAVTYAPTLGTSRNWGANVLSFSGQDIAGRALATRQTFLTL